MRKYIKAFFSVVLLILAGVVITGCGHAKGGDWSGVSGISIPWGDYEESAYSFITDGKGIGEVKFIIRKEILNKKEAYRIDVPITAPGVDIATGAVVEADMMKPISSYVKRHYTGANQASSIDINGVYKEKLCLTAVTGQKTQNLDVNLWGECLDNESVNMAIRTFPLAEGFSKQFALGILSVAKAVLYEVKVTGREKVKVPYGEYDCYMVEMYEKQSGPASAIKYWISADDRKLMIRFEQSSTVFELKSVKTEK